MKIPERIPGTKDCMDLSELDFEVVNLLMNSYDDFTYNWNGKEWVRVVEDNDNQGSKQH